MADVVAFELDAFQHNAFQTNDYASPWVRVTITSTSICVVQKVRSKTNALQAIDSNNMRQFVRSRWS